MVTRTILAANREEQMLMRFTVEGTPQDIERFAHEFALGSIKPEEEWLFVVCGFHDLDVFDFTLYHTRDEEA